MMVSVKSFPVQVQRCHTYVHKWAAAPFREGLYCEGSNRGLSIGPLHVRALHACALFCIHPVSSNLLLGKMYRIVLA